MAVIKCKMCGGDLNFEEGATVCECEYCGSKQTLPAQDNEKKLSLFSRANRLLRLCDFDKAAGVYESIVAEFPEEAEAYWGLVLSKYGIEYVDDPATGKKVPTCHRSGFDSVMDDADFELVMEYADSIARREYRDEAKQIEELRRSIIEVSSTEQPYDIFISYKEKDDSGERTLDSVLAQDIYDALTDKGYRVFFSRISLEDRLGTEYEPYIFAALNSAKVMLVVGTDYDYFNAVWVKNEWSRYLKLMAQDKSKHLIPCYKNIDAYDMPKEFNKLTAQDLGKVGATQDLLRGIDKLLGRDTATKTQPVQPQTIVQQVVTGGTTADAQVTRGNMALEDHEWKKADGFFEEALNLNPECADAWLGKLCANMQASNRELAKKCFIEKDYTNNVFYKHARQFADDMVLAELTQWESQRISFLKEKAESEQREKDEKERLDHEAREAARIRLPEIRNKQMHLQSIISAADGRVEGICEDGTVSVDDEWHLSSEESVINSWRDIIAVSASEFHSVALKADGTVIATGANSHGECEVRDWNSIIAISTGVKHTVGLKADGTVVATGDPDSGRCDVSTWHDIIAIAAGRAFTIGLKSDGTVLATGYNGYGQCNVSGWNDIVAVAAGDGHTLGLKADGTMLAKGWKGGNNYYDPAPCDVDQWRDIVAIAAGRKHSVGLRADGTVVATHQEFYGSSKIREWNSIVAIAAGGDETLGLKSDGNVLSLNRDIKLSKQILYSGGENHIPIAEHLMNRKKQEKDSLMQELAGLGKFSLLRRTQINCRLAEINTELQKYTWRNTQ